MKTLKDRIYDLLVDIDDTEMISIHNEYCNECKYYDEYIDRVADIDDMYSGLKPSEVIDRLEGINPRHTYYVIGIYGTESFDYYYGCPVEQYDEIAQYCADNEDDLGNDGIRQRIDEWNEEHEQED